MINTGFRDELTTIIVCINSTRSFILSALILGKRGETGEAELCTRWLTMVKWRYIFWLIFWFRSLAKPLSQIPQPKCYSSSSSPPADYFCCIVRCRILYFSWCLIRCAKYCNFRTLIFFDNSVSLFILFKSVSFLTLSIQLIRSILR